MGRWVTPDPSGLAYADPQNPQTLNLYAYAGSNPLTEIDPDGLTSSRAPCGGATYAAESLWGRVETFVSNLFCNFGTDNRDMGPDYDPYFNGWLGSGSSAPGQSQSPSLQAISQQSAPINVGQRISHGRQLLSQRCKSKFARSFHGYTTNSFFNNLNNATINQYPGGTPPQDMDQFGADAVTHPASQTVDLLPNFYRRDATSQSYVLIHEGIHLFGRGTLGDSTVMAKFGLSGYGTDSITQYIAGGCYP